MMPADPSQEHPTDHFFRLLQPCFHQGEAAELRVEGMQRLDRINQEPKALARTEVGELEVRGASGKSKRERV